MSMSVQLDLYILRDILNFDSIINTMKIPSHMCGRDEPECFYIKFEYFLIKSILKWYFFIIFYMGMEKPSRNT